ncbi:MAG: peptide chain release factor 2 [Planctomycetaceae bacterium]|nr:peptide chain release factor 2 [Planctomycetaceae bacterium]
MSQEWSERCKELSARVLQLKDSLDYEKRLLEIGSIEHDMSRDGFWNDSTKSQAAVAKLKALKSSTAKLGELVKAEQELPELLSMAEEDENFGAEFEVELTRLEKLLSELELQSLLNGPHDQSGAILSINARDGGTDANDWAEMLLKMYISWGRDNGFDVALLDRSDNDEAGINQATIAVRGPMAYGYLKGETGMHRLVRISPFNSEGKRQTSFAAVDVTPEVEDAEEIKIDPQDVRVDTFRASGAGGQHVNKTDSAVRLTHIPTNAVVQCQSERSQHQNRDQAWKMLRAKLAQLEEQRREEEEAAKYQTKVRVGFGSQIRNYFLHPDQRIKDVRTGHAMGSFHAVMGGDIQGFLDAYLAWRAKEAGLSGISGESE